MRRLTAFIGLILAMSASLAGQSGNWVEVERLDAGRRIELRTTAEPQRKFRGLLRTTTQDSLTLVEEPGVERSYARTEITRVRLRRSNIAPVAGVAAGAGWGGLVAGISEGGAGQKAVAVAAAAAIGWLIGKGIQKGNWKTIYESAP